MEKIRQFLETLAIGLAGGLIFKLLHIPLPWTLGPLTAAALAGIRFKRKIFWPVQVRDAAIVILGYAMGRTFTVETGQRILSYLPLLIIISIFSLLLCVLGGFITRRYTGVSLPTALFGSMPAGLSQTAVIIEDLADADLGVIALMHTVRVIAVVFIVPFLALHGLAGQANTAPAAAAQGNGPPDIYTIAAFFTVILVCVSFGKHMKVPAGVIIIPIISTAVLTLLGLSGPSLPSGLVAVAQVFVGIRIAMSVNIGSLADWKRITAFSLLHVMGLLSVLSLVDYLVTRATPLSFLTIFIGTAPGGMTEMGLTAMMVNADLPTVISFQLFRLLFVYLISMPAMRWWFRRKSVQATEGLTNKELAAAINKETKD